MRKARALPLVLLLLAACTPEAPEPRAPEAARPPEAASASTDEPAPAVVSGSMRVVDRQGTPLAGMAPIATRQPNAFDAPVATGPLTGPDGRGRIAFPGDARLYLRAWDPELGYFPNNFYDILPDTGDVTDEMVIEMVPAAALLVLLQQADGRPLADADVAMMMIHPTRGPWWPAEARTSSEGVAAFTRVPPGAFTLRFKTGDGALLEVPEAALPPGQTTDLGPRRFP